MASKKRAKRISWFEELGRKFPKIRLKFQNFEPKTGKKHFNVPYASQVFRRLNDWLAQFKNPVLIAHNGFRFDAPILISSMIRYKLYDQFRARVSHFGDTLGELKAVLPDGVRSGATNFQFLRFYDL